MRLMLIFMLAVAGLAGCASLSPQPPPPAPMAPLPPPPPPPPPMPVAWANQDAQRQAPNRARVAAARKAEGKQTTATTTTRAEPASVAAAPAQPETEAPTPDTSTTAVDQILSQLVLGDVAFNAPEKINIEDTVSIRVALSPDQGAAAVSARIEEPGKRIAETLQVSNLMQARLTGEGFKIVAVTPEKQAVSSGITEWLWDVTPLEEGKHQLTLSMDALITVNGEVVPKTLRTYRKPIEVEVTTAQVAGNLLSEHGKWAWSTLLLPLFAWFAKKRKDRAGGKTA
jgi:hypothetical protein